MRFIAQADPSSSSCSFSSSHILLPRTHTLCTLHTDLALGPAPAIKSKRGLAPKLGAANKKKEVVDLPPLPGSLVGNSSIISEASGAHEVATDVAAAAAAAATAAADDEEVNDD